MNQYDFDVLLRKYLAGTCSPAEEKLILDWSENMLKHSPLAMPETEKDEIRVRLWRRLGVKNQLTRMYQNTWFRTGIAASVLILGAFLAFSHWPAMIAGKKTLFADSIHVNSTLPDAPSGNIEIKNTSPKPYEITLNDGSDVTLQPGSSLSYPEHFNDHFRNVYLSGEAFFEVKKDASKPFLVHAGELVTQVLGTSFNVKSYDASSSIEVAVITGRVSVYENLKKSPQARNGIILSPNQKIVFNKGSKTLIPELVTEPVVIHPPETKARFIFDETQLPQVLSMIQDAYGIEIVVENNALDGCVFTGDINDLPLYSQLKMICRAVNATYELRGTTFFLSGEGCKN